MLQSVKIDIGLRVYEIVRWHRQLKILRLRFGRLYDCKMFTMLFNVKIYTVARC